MLNSLWDEKEIGEHLPNAMKRYLAENEINFYIINGTKIGQQLGLGNRTNTIMQSAFFKITNVIPYDLAVSEMKKAIDKSYGKKGEAVVKMNYAAVPGSDATGDPSDPFWNRLYSESVHRRPDAAVRRSHVSVLQPV